MINASVDLAQFTFITPILCSDEREMQLEQRVALCQNLREAIVSTAAMPQ